MKLQGTPRFSRSDCTAQPRGKWIQAFGNPDLKEAQNSLVPCPERMPRCSNGFFKQVADGVAEPRQELLALEKAASANQLTLRERVTDLDRFGFGVDDPCDLRTAGEEVL